MKICPATAMFLVLWLQTPGPLAAEKLPPAPEVEYIASPNPETRVVQCRGTGEDLEAAIADARRGCLDGFIRRLMAVTRGEEQRYKQRRELILGNLEGLVDRPEVQAPGSPDRTSSRVLARKRIDAGRIEIVVQLRVHIDAIQSRLGAAAQRPLATIPAMAVRASWQSETAGAKQLERAAAAIRQCLTQVGLKFLTSTRGETPLPDLELAGSVLFDRLTTGEITPAISVSLRETETSIVAASSSTMGKRSSPDELGGVMETLFRDTCDRLERQLATYARSLSEVGRRYEILVLNPPRRADTTLHRLLKQHTVKLETGSHRHSLRFKFLSKLSLDGLQKKVEEELRSLPGGKTFRVVKRTPRVLVIQCGAE